MILDVVRRFRPEPHQGLLRGPGFAFPCSLGRSGITTRKREGDGATPTGDFAILYGFYRSDRINRPKTTLPMYPIDKLDGWCDDPTHPSYNSLVRLPFEKSHETMMRKDRLYDVCIVLDHNIFPQIKGAGSAIFFHQRRPDEGPTEGCVAIAPHHMQLLLPRLTPTCRMRISI